MGVENFDILGIHPLLSQVDQGPRQHFEIAFAVDGPGLLRSGRHLHLSLLEVTGPEELAPHPAPDG